MDVGFGLLANGVEMLAEVATAMGQGDGDYGGGGVGSGTEGIASEHPQATGVGR